jgi:hypothetical protein
MDEKIQPANIVDIFGATDERKLREIFNPAANYVRNYIVLDTKYRVIDDTVQTTLDHYTFYYSIGRIAAPGTFQSSFPISNIMSMKMFKTRVPNIPNASTGARRISVAINEFTAQAFILSTGTKAHWVLGIEDIADSHCTDMIIENYDDGIFNFSVPINIVDKITLSFNDPLNKISWWNDRDTCTFTYGLNTTITTTLPNNFDPTKAPYTFVSFTNFTTADPIADKAIIDFINSGELAAVIIGANQLELVRTVTNVSPFLYVPLDTSTLTALPPGTQFNVFYEERRIFMPIELLCIPEAVI